jgi:hypothetical protein
MEGKNLAPNAKDHEFLQDVFLKNLPEKHPTAKMQSAACFCASCACPPNSGDLCDSGGTAVAYSGTYAAALADVSE